MRDREPLEPLDQQILACLIIICVIFFGAGFAIGAVIF